MNHTLPSLQRRAFVWALPGAFLAALDVPGTARAQPTVTGFDHRHAAWDAVVRQHVVVAAGGNASALRYAALRAQRAVLGSYLNSLSAVSPASYGAWSKAQQLAFLINAYNAFTVELILTKYPALKSIKDLGSLFSSPWKPKWIALLGDTVSLDDIEHGMLRARGRYDDPRIHFAVNCASVGCPMLREEAYAGERLEAQLDEQTRRFLSDRTRNRWNGQRGRLEVSKIFDWYGEDFRLGHRGIRSLAAFLAGHAERLADDEAARARVRSGQVEMDFLAYDWSLNDAG